jgi:hypothetical protein
MIKSYKKKKLKDKISNLFFSVGEKGVKLL